MKILTKEQTCIVAKKGDKTIRLTWRLDGTDAILKIEEKRKKEEDYAPKRTREYKFDSFGQLYSILLGILDLRPSELNISVVDGERTYMYGRICLTLGQPISEDSDK